MNSELIVFNNDNLISDIFSYLSIKNIFDFRLLNKKIFKICSKLLSIKRKINFDWTLDEWLISEKYKLLIGSSNVKDFSIRDLASICKGMTATDLANSFEIKSLKKVIVAKKFYETFVNGYYARLFTF